MSMQPEGKQELAFGLFDWIDAAPGRTAGEVYEGRLRLLAEADRGGFAVYHLAEHHGTPLGLSPSPAVFLAAAARVTERIRLAPTTFIVPLYDPLRLVEEIGMLDQLSGGRLEIGVGKGSSPHEAGMFGLTPPQTAERFEELMPAILEAMETGVFRRPGADGGTITLHVPTRQRPHPPLWYPTSNPASIPRLGDEGYNVIFGFGFVSPASGGVWGPRATTSSSGSGSPRRRWTSSGSRASSSSSASAPPRSGGPSATDCRG